MCSEDSKSVDVVKLHMIANFVEQARNMCCRDISTTFPLVAILSNIPVSNSGYLSVSHAGPVSVQHVRTLDS